MGKKRKTEDRGPDEADFRLYASFCVAAKNISQSYTQAKSQQDLAYQNGERHCAERLYWWLNNRESKSVDIEEITRFLQQDDLDASSGGLLEMSSQPVISCAAHQQPQSLPSGDQVLYEAFEPSGLGLESRALLSDNNRLAFFPSSFSSQDGNTIASFGSTQLQGGHASVQYSSGNLGWQAEPISENKQEALPNEMACEGFEHSRLGHESRTEPSGQNRPFFLSSFSSLNQGMIPSFGLSQFQGRHSSMEYSTGTLGWQAEPTVEQHQGASPDGTQLNF